MKANKHEIILTERAADSESLRAVLRDWGYHENEIHLVLPKQTVDQKRDEAIAKSIKATDLKVRPPSRIQNL